MAILKNPIFTESKYFFRIARRHVCKLSNSSRIIYSAFLTKEHTISFKIIKTVFFIFLKLMTSYLVLKGQLRNSECVTQCAHISSSNSQKHWGSVKNRIYKSCLRKNIFMYFQCLIYCTFSKIVMCQKGQGNKDLLTDTYTCPLEVFKILSG